MSLPPIYRRVFMRAPVVMTTRDVRTARIGSRRGVRDILHPSRALIAVTNSASILDNQTLIIPFWALGDRTFRMHVGAGYVPTPGQTEVNLVGVGTNADAATAISLAISGILAGASQLAQQGTTLLQNSATLILLSWDQAGRVGRPIAGTIAGVTFVQPHPASNPEPLANPNTYPAIPFIARCGKRMPFRKVVIADREPGGGPS